MPASGLNGRTFCRADKRAHAAALPRALADDGTHLGDDVGWGLIEFAHELIDRRAAHRIDLEAALLGLGRSAMVASKALRSACLRSAGRSAGAANGRAIDCRLKTS